MTNKWEWNCTGISVNDNEMNEYAKKSFYNEGKEIFIFVIWPHNDMACL